MEIKKRWWLVPFLAAGVLVAAQMLTVGVMKTNLLANPDFFSASLGTLKNGDKLEVLQESSGWYLVKGPGGQKGYVHKSAVKQAAKGSALSGLLPGQKNATQDEVALAAKGFNEGNEKRIRDSKGFNFADLDWVMAQTIGTSALGDFVREGKLK